MLPTLGALLQRKPPSERRFSTRCCVLAVTQPANGLGGRRVAGVALRQLDTPCGEERPHPVVARLAVHVPGVVGDRIERDELFPCSRRSRRYPSNISFQAAAWTVAVRVSTPSRSNRHARTLSGKPITATPSVWSRASSLPHASRLPVLLQSL